MEVIDERIDLIEKIRNNEISKKQVEKEVKRLEDTYGKEAFTSFNFEKEQKPWKEDYFKKLKTLSMAGAGSKEFILHLVEVRDEIRKSAKRKFIPLFIIGLLLIAALLWVIFWNVDKNESDSSKKLVPAATIVIKIYIS